MTAIIIKRQLNKEEIDEIIDLSAKEKSIKLYTSVSIPGKLKNLNFYNPELTESEKKKINYNIIRYTTDFGEKKIEGKTIREWLTFGKASIWHYHKFRIYFSVRNLSIELAEIKQILNLSASIILYTNDSRLKKLVPRVKDKNIDIRCRNTKLKKDYLSYIHYFAYLKLRLLQNIFISLRKAKHMVFDVTLPVTYLDIPDLKSVKGNYVIGYLLKKIDSGFILNNEIETPKFTRNKKFRIGKNIHRKLYSIKTIHSEGLLFKRLFSVNIIKQLINTARQLKSFYIKAEDTLRTEPDNLFIDLLKKYHKTALYFIFKYYAYRSFFLKYRIRSISSTDENSPEIKSVLDAAKSAGVITVGIQHGAIHELHPAYMFSTGDRANKIMPDYTLVWGEFYKKILAEKGNYDPDSLIVSGHIRSDIIPYLERKENIPGGTLPDKPVIVFASQPQRDQSLRRLAAVDIFTAAKKLKDICLIVKLHPAEKNDKEYYNSLARETGCDNYKILYEEDLYKLIASCSALITCFSTVGTETAYFYKPLIILDHLKQDIQGYKKEGIAFQVTGPEELFNCIKGILDGKLTINKHAYDMFIGKYAYKIDGRSSERCLDFIKSLD